MPSSNSQSSLRWDDLPGDDVRGAMALLRRIQSACPGTRIQLTAGSPDAFYLQLLQSMGLLQPVKSDRAGTMSFAYEQPPGA